MDISNINNNNNDLWKGLQDAIETLDSLKGTDVGTVLGADGTNLTVTFTGTDGVARTIQLELPELEEGATAPDPEVVEALLDKIDEMAAELEAQAAPSVDQLEKMVQATGANAQSTGFRKALFDVYSLMCLMVDLATAQREVARNLRQQELIGQVASIQAKAAAARTTALVGMVTSVAMTVVQLGASAIAAKISHSASKAANQGETLGLKSARTDLKILNDAVKNPKTFPQVVDKYAAAAGPEGVQTVEASFNEVVGEKAGALETAQRQLKWAEADAAQAKSFLNEAQGKLETANGKVATCEQQVAADQQAVDALGGKELATAKEGLAGAQRDLAKLDHKVARQGFETPEDSAQRAYLRNEIKTYEAKVAELEPRVGPAAAKLAESQKALEGAKAEQTAAQNRVTQLEGYSGKVEEAQQQVAKAKEEYGQALDKFMGRADAELTGAQSELRRLKALDPKPEQEIKTQEETVKKLSAQHDYAKALVTGKKLGAGLSIDGDLQKATERVENLENKLPNDADFKALMAKSDKWRSISSVAAQMTNLVNAISGFASACEQTAVAEKESEAARREAYRQESTELQESAQKLLDSVLQTLRELVQMESGSLDRIIGNI